MLRWGCRQSILFRLLNSLEACMCHDWRVLSCKTQTNLVNAETYFDQHLRVGDYYGQDGQTLGQWHGLGAEKIGLRNTIQRDDFLQLCQNLNPATGERLTQRHKTTRLESGHELPTGAFSMILRSHRPNLFRSWRWWLKISG